MRKGILKSTLYLCYIFIAILPYGGWYYMHVWYNKEVEKIDYAKFLIISKEDMKLSVYNYRGEKITSYPIACGKAYGNKKTKGDMKTPEGIFHISEIVDSSTWVHDFNDEKGEIPNAYGSHFIRLEVTGYKGIGIHGTHKPESIGTRDTEGCIRLHNTDLKELVQLVKHGMVVIITPSSKDIYDTNN